MINTWTYTDLQTLSPEEQSLFEATLYWRTCLELTQHLTEKYQHFQRLIKPLSERGAYGMEKIFIRCIINDIISSGEYTLTGIAHELRAPEDVVYEMAIGLNTDPSWRVCKKLLTLHWKVRPELYESIYKKALSEYPQNEKE